MRTLLAGELTTSQSAWPDYYLKLEVENDSGTWIDISTIYNCVINATWGEDVNTPVGSATITLVRKAGGVSLAPLIVASTANVNDALAYAPLLDIGRLIKFSVATMDNGVALDTGKRRQAFTGRIDTVAFGSGDTGHSPITIQCSDLGGWLMDTQIETADVGYGTPSGVPLENVLQEIVADWPDGGPAVTVVKQSTSNFAVTDWTQPRVKVLEALRTLTLETTGEDIRYRHDASHVSQLMWFDPDRDRVSVDQTFAASRYLVNRLDVELADIRNAGSMSWTGGVVTSNDAPSITKFRRRYFELPGSTALTTVAQAQAVIDATVSDLKSPLGEVAAVFPDRLLWFVQLYDRYTFLANGRDFDYNQTFAVSGYRHTLEHGRGSTTLTCSGHIIGAYGDWLRRITWDPMERPEALYGLLDFRVISETSTERTYGWTRGAFVAEVWAAEMDFDTPLPADPWVQVAAISAPLPAGQDSLTVRQPADRKEKLIQVEPRDALLVPGPLRRATLKAAPVQPPVIDTDAIEIDTVGTLWWKVQERGTLVVSVMAQTQVGGDGPSGFVIPLRSQGAYSYVKNRTLLSGEYEHDVRLDPTRQSFVTVRIVLSSGEVMVVGPVRFDRNTIPDIVLLAATGTIITAIGDSDVKGWKFVAVGRSWQLTTGGISAVVDVSKPVLGVVGIAPGETWLIDATAYSAPVAYVTSSTPSATASVMVTAPAPPPPLPPDSTPLPPVWDATGLASPVHDSRTLTALLDASASAGFAVRVWEKHDDGSGFTAPVDITAALSPVPGAPPLTQTTYTWSGLPTTYNRTYQAGGGRAIEVEMTFEIIQSGNVVATRTSPTSWWYGGNTTITVPPPTTITPDPVVDPDYTPPAAWQAVSMSEPAIGSHAVTITLDADSSVGTVRLHARVDDSSGWTDYGDITSQVTPTLTAPPIASTVYTWSVLSSQYNRVTSGLRYSIVVEVVAEIMQNGIVVSTRTESAAWQYSAVLL